MKQYRFKKIDAFATEKSDGNPAGYIALERLEDISEHEMLHIANELKGFVNEVGFVAQTGIGEFDLRYFSSEREVDFCGHATIAIMYDIIKTDISLTNVPILTIHTKKGTLKVENRFQDMDAVFIMAPKPEIRDVSVDVDVLSAKLCINKEIIDNRFSISVINAGLNTLIVPIKDLNSTLTVTPIFEDLKAYCFSIGVDIIEVFTTDVSKVANDVRTRVFAPTFGYLEDPATGSGNSALGYYLSDNGFWENDSLTIEQNGEKDNFNIVKLQKQNDEDGNMRVRFGGSAITRIDGKYLTYNK